MDDCCIVTSNPGSGGNDKSSTKKETWGHTLTSFHLTDQNIPSLPPDLCSIAGILKKKRRGSRCWGDNRCVSHQDGKKGNSQQALLEKVS